MKGIIYCAKSPNEKKYYGQTICSLKRRQNQHKNAALNNCPYLLHKAIRKYGFENFTWAIIEIHEDSKENILNLLNERETFWIKKDKTYLPEFGYNLKAEGKNGFLSDLVKLKISNSKKGKKYSEKTKQLWSEQRKGEKNGMYGKSFYDIWVEKYGIDEANNKLKLFKEKKKGLPSIMKNKHHTEKSKLKMRDSKLGKHLHEEVRKKMSLSRKGKKHSEETKIKIGLKHKGKKLSNETKQKISKTKKLNNLAINDI